MTTSAVPLPEPAPRTSLIDWCERGKIPDWLVRFGMRRLIAARLREEVRGGLEAISERQAALIQSLRASPIAVETDAANQQHYEVPTAFFKTHLGPRMKYSCCLYPSVGSTLAEAEEAMLSLYAERAGLADGQRILDLGCGWGSLSLWMAQRFPGATIVGLSNSNGQRQYIEAEAVRLGITNLSIVTANVAEFDFSDAPGQAGFDRILSIEMFEHMKNYRALLAKIARWLAPEGRLFVHIFAHRHVSYPFEDRDASDWMTRYFFTGGIMPSAALLVHFQDDLHLLNTWWVDGRHYERTANDWLARLDQNRAEALPILSSTYGPAEAAVWFQRWRMFYMAVAELFGYQRGEEWGVAHYLFSRRR